MKDDISDVHPDIQTIHACKAVERPKRDAL